MTEPLTDVLAMLRIEAVVYYDHAFSAPLAMRFAQSASARVHVLLDGRCSIEANGTVATLAPNDVVLVAGGDEHVVSDGTTNVVRDSRDVYAEAVRNADAMEREAPVARLISGHIAFDGDARRLLFATLPTMIRTSLDDAAHGDIALLREQLSHELHAKLRGWEAVVQRIAEILLIRIVRSRLAATPPTQGGLFAALADARLHAAIRGHARTL